MNNHTVILPRDYSQMKPVPLFLLNGLGGEGSDLFAVPYFCCPVVLVSLASKYQTRQVITDINQSRDQPKGKMALLVAQLFSAVFS